MQRRTFIIGSAIVGAFCYGAYKVLSIERTPIEGLYTVYGLRGCIWCKALRETLILHRLPHAFLDIENNMAAQNFYISHRFPGVPQVFGPDKEYIGGYPEMEEHLRKVHGIEIKRPE